MLYIYGAHRADQKELMTLKQWAKRPPLVGLDMTESLQRLSVINWELRINGRDSAGSIVCLIKATAQSCGLNVINGRRFNDTSCVLGKKGHIYIAKWRLCRK